MLLRSVNDACKSRLLKTYETNYLERENQLSFVIDYIFMTTTTISQIARVLLFRRSDVEIFSKLLMTVATTLEVMIENDADVIETKTLELVYNVELVFS